MVKTTMAPYRPRSSPVSRPAPTTAPPRRPSKWAAPRGPRWAPRRHRWRWSESSCAFFCLEIEKTWRFHGWFAEFLQNFMDIFWADFCFVGFTDGFSGTSWRFNGDVSGIQASQNANELGFKQLRFFGGGIEWAKLVYNWAMLDLWWLWL